MNEDYGHDNSLAELDQLREQGRAEQRLETAHWAFVAGQHHATIVFLREALGQVRKVVTGEYLDPNHGALWDGMAMAKIEQIIDGALAATTLDQDAGEDAGEVVVDEPAPAAVVYFGDEILWPGHKH